MKRWRPELTSGQIGLLFSLAGIFGPLALVLMAGGIGSALGCAVNEGGGTPCLLAGMDIEPWLTLMFTFYLFLLLAPAFLVIAVVSLFQIIRERRQ